MSQAKIPTFGPARVTALVPTYNRAQYLPECLDSLLTQSRKPDQIVVIDDGSTDGTESIVSKYGHQVQYVKKSNGGKSSALNLGLKYATGDLIWVCDDDDIAAVDGLEMMLAAFEANPGADYVFGDYWIFEIAADGTKLVYDPSFLRRSDEPNLKINFLEDMFMLQYASLVRKSVYEDLGGYDESLIRSQDYDMMLRVSRRHTGVYTPHVIFHYRHHQTPRGNAGGLFSVAENFTQWRKYDRIIFSRIRETYALPEFTPSFATGLPWADRSAYIQRALVIAKRGLWSEAAEDLSAAERNSAEPLAEAELDLLQSIVHSHEAWLILGQDRSAMASLSEICFRSKTGQRLILRLLRPLLWLIRNSARDGDYRRAAACIAILYRIAGLRGAVSLLRKRDRQ